MIAIFLFLASLPSSTSHSSSTEHQTPTNAPTSSYHFQNSVFFEALSIVSLIVMTIVLFLGFFGDCFGILCPRPQPGILEPRNFGRESTREGLNKYSLELSAKHSIKETPLELISKVQQALEIYLREHGNDHIPSGWKVPTVNPWPSNLWGFDLGHHLNSLCGTSTVFPSKPISQGIPARIEHSHSTDSHDDSQQHETWYELFYDLVFVASAIQLGTVIKYDHRPLGMAKAAVLFLMLRSAWDHLTLYQNRFHINDVSHMAYYLMQAMGIFIIALHLQVEEDVHNENQHSWDRSKHQHPISLVATICRILTVVMYSRAVSVHPDQSAYLFRVICHNSASAVIFGLSLLTPTDDATRLYLIVWAIGIFVEQPLMHVIAVIFPTDAPPLILEKHIGHLVDRQGTFFMLILGEAVIQLVQAQTTFHIPSYARALLGFAVVFNVGNVYYEQQQREPSRHVLTRSNLLGYLWIDLQSLLSMLVLFFAVGIKLVFHSFDEHQIIRDEFLMCGFASLSLLLMYTMSLMHRGFEYNFLGTSRRLFYHLFFYFLALACAVIPFFATSSTVSIVFLHIFTTLLVIQDVGSRTLRIYELRNVRHLSQKDASRVWSAAMDTSLSSDIYNIGMDESMRTGTGMDESSRTDDPILPHGHGAHSSFDPETRNGSNINGNGNGNGIERHQETMNYRSSAQVGRYSQGTE